MRHTGTRPPSRDQRDRDAGAREQIERRQRGAGPLADRRAQTTLDFAVGMSVFLLSLTFILLFVPGMLGPFVGGTQDEVPSANRVADDLAMRLLGSPSEPYVLDRDCTAKFFESGSVTGCRFSGSTIHERVGIVDRTNVNVTIRGNVTDTSDEAILCWNDAGDGSVVEPDDAACTPGSNGDLLLTRGSNPENSGSRTVSARRVVYLDGHDVTIEVVMW